MPPLIASSDESSPSSTSSDGSSAQWSTTTPASSNPETPGSWDHWSSEELCMLQSHSPCLSDARRSSVITALVDIGYDPDIVKKLVQCLQTDDMSVLLPCLEAVPSDEEDDGDLSDSKVASTAMSKSQSSTSTPLVRPAVATSTLTMKAGQRTMIMVDSGSFDHVCPMQFAIDCCQEVPYPVSESRAVTEATGHAVARAACRRRVWLRVSSSVILLTLNSWT